jgi:outer membrane lipoprotein-sorting protein
MNCREFRKGLDDFLLTDIEDGIPIAWAGHMKECSKCAQAYEIASNTLSRIRLSREVKASTRLKEGIRKALKESPRETSGDSRRDEERYHIKENVFMNIFGKSGMAKTKWAVSAAIFILVIVLVFGPGGGQNGSSLALADARQQAQSIHSATWTLTVRRGDEDASSQERMFLEPGRLRADWESGVVTILDREAGKCLTLIPWDKEYVAEQLEPAAGVNPIESMRSLPDQAGETLGEEEIDGRKAQGYKIFESDQEIEIWIDIETLNPVFMEYWTPGKELRQTNTGFKVNIPLDESLFSLAPPADYTPLPE